MRTIVGDLTMPDVWGAELYEQLRRDHPGLEQRLVFMTGGAFTASAAQFVESVPTPCLHKPFAVEALLDAIERVASR